MHEMLIGHKRNMKEYPFCDSYKIDITEIDGFDNLHEAHGIIEKAQERAALNLQAMIPCILAVSHLMETYALQ